MDFEVQCPMSGQGTGVVPLNHQLGVKQLGKQSVDSSWIELEPRAVAGEAGVVTGGEVRGPKQEHQDQKGWGCIHPNSTVVGRNGAGQGPRAEAGQLSQFAYAPAYSWLYFFQSQSSQISKLEGIYRTPHNTPFSLSGHRYCTSPIVTEHLLCVRVCARSGDVEHSRRLTQEVEMCTLKT